MQALPTVRPNLARSAPRVRPPLAHAAILAAPSCRLECLSFRAHSRRLFRPSKTAPPQMAGVRLTVLLLVLCLTSAAATTPSCASSCPSEQPAGVTCLVGMTFSNVPAAVNGAGICVCSAGGNGGFAPLPLTSATTAASCTSNACVAAGKSMSGQTAMFMNSTGMAAYMLEQAQDTLDSPTVGVMCASANLFCSQAASAAGSCPASMIGTTLTLQYAVAAGECSQGLSSIMSTKSSTDAVGTYFDLLYDITTFYSRFPRFGEQLYSIQMCTTNNCNVPASASTSPALCNQHGTSSSAAAVGYSFVLAATAAAAVFMAA